MIETPGHFRRAIAQANLEVRRIDAIDFFKLAACGLLALAVLKSLNSLTFAERAVAFSISLTLR